MIQQWSWGYWLLKQYVRLAWWLFHRRMVIVGKENIPAQQPVIFASNHPNALSDILCLVIAVPRQVVWMGRASLFNNHWVRPILHFLKIFPVYRIRDGKDSLQGNEASFATAVDILRNNGALGIYPEAAHSGQRKMLSHKKAIPRIVFMAGEMTHDTLDIQIVPVGIHYDQYFRFGRRVLVTIGKPLPARDYYAQYHENQRLATQNLRDDIHGAILPLVLDYRSGEFYEGFEALRELAGRPFSREWSLPATMPGDLLGEQRLAARLDTLAATHPDKAASLAAKGLALLHDFRHHKVRSWLTCPGEEKTSKALLHALLLLLSLPLFLFGWCFNIIPFAGLWHIIRRKAADPVWISTFTFGLGILVFPLIYLLEMMAAGPLLPGWPLKLLFLLSLPFAGKFSFSWYILYLKTRGRWRWLQIKKRKPDLYRNLCSRQEEIMKELSLLPDPA